jgi:hypothetical protein
VLLPILKKQVGKTVRLVGILRQQLPADAGDLRPAAHVRGHPHLPSPMNAKAYDPEDMPGVFRH